MGEDGAQHCRHQCYCSEECPGPWSGAAWCPAVLAILCAAGRSYVLPLAVSLLLSWVFFMVPQISCPLFLSVRQLRPSRQVCQEGKVLQDGSILLLQEFCVLAPCPPFPLAVSKGLPSSEFQGSLCWGLSSLGNVSLLPTSCGVHRDGTLASDPSLTGLWVPRSCKQALGTAAVMGVASLMVPLGQVNLGYLRSLA